MVGDGANDCQALKAADVGLALNAQEASLAADFTSYLTTDVSIANSLLREGKACMATSLASFKYMSFYSFIQFSTICILY
jgi:cation-transporting ATPase 13A3/4/5